MDRKRRFVALVMLLTSVLPPVLFTGCGKGQRAAPLPEKNLAGEKVVMIVAHQDFRDEELFGPKEVLEDRGAGVVVASSSLEEAHGMLGSAVKPDFLLEDVHAADYNAVIFVGGQGAAEYWEDPEAHRVAREALEEGKVLGAICLAPVTLANAGVLSGRKATVYPDEAARLKSVGAVYTGARVEVDGRIVTASGPESAKEFGEAISGAWLGIEAVPVEWAAKLENRDYIEELAVRLWGAALERRKRQESASQRDGKVPQVRVHW